MHLANCSPPHPKDALEPAPAPSTALLGEPVDGEHWDGFWSHLSDAYYVRRTRHDGAVEWYQVADDDSNATVTPDPRVLEFRPQHRVKHRVAVIVAQSPGGRRMLVGTAGRAAR